ncbi:MAG TPA: S-methyl-5'-thioadenosine phosphorylase [Humidesulfovibrio sp.]|uniref:S-methyl-5'-thioadenosine phosphorylase n=1 Tax=Humidesulfovibrio sp. TaxID=2910988 RepID=UPI002B8C7F64|nr:S-methyl-5'-thioadenosine phosphorylase [Humidesulfovibrio sp.]HWR02724.1 S-methyl-5'-thioadenosine phosphorylase [Humidesulfovibrio sp.]
MSIIGIIGGSGLDNPDILRDPRDERVATPYGELPSPVRVGNIGQHTVCLVARHGREHTVPPSQVNHRATIASLRSLGCTAILATTAVGSLREEIRRGDLVVLDQFIDFTRHRAITFHESFAPHEPVHTPMADPFDASLRGLLNDCCVELGIAHHKTGTVVTIEGPRFSTRAESNMFRLWGADVINMSVAPECILANEARIPYAAIAMSTDYDCWKTDEAPVTWEDILNIFRQNAQKVTDLLIRTIGKMA